MKRVLFVDDEQKILSGLKRSFYSFHKDWNISFLDNGSDALKFVGDNKIDVVISDMKMPGMNGAILLSKLKEISPDTVRIILSGYSELESTVKAVAIAHQYIAKPCKPQFLKNVIDRACHLNELFLKKEVLEVYERFVSLESKPKIFTLINKYISDKVNSVEDVLKIIDQYPEISKSIIDQVNSKLLCDSDKIKTVEDAVDVFGVNFISSMIFSIEIYQQFKTNEVVTSGFSVESLQEHGLLIAALSSKIAINRKQSAEVFIAGLLHDIGRYVLAKVYPDRYNHICLQAIQDKRDVHELEEQEFGINHADIGACLLHKWGFPNEVVEAVVYHHNPQEVLHSNFEVLDVIYVTHILIKQNQCDYEVPDGFLDYLSSVGMADNYIKWKSLAKEMLSMASFK